MKHTNILIYCIVLLLAASCKKDDKNPPSAVLTGQVVYQNQPLSLRSGGVELELWQHGYQLFTKIPVHIKDDGSFSAKLFNGDYKLTLLPNNGPWVNNTDSIDVRLNGNADIQVNVEPYFIVNSASFQKTGNTVTANVSLQQVNNSRPLEAVRLYIGQTTLTDQNINLVNVSVPAADIDDISQPIVLSAEIPAALASKNFVFARIGVKIDGIAELLYSTPEEISVK